MFWAWYTNTYKKNTCANISEKENDVTTDLNKIRKSCHQEYISSNCNAAVDDINKDTNWQLWYW